MNPSSEDFPEFPVPPRAFDGASRRVDPGAAFEWLRHGWAMFLANPGVWIGCALLMLLILIALSRVPILGYIASQLLMPVFGAGVLQLCRRQSEGAAPQVADLFIGFRQRAGDLVTLGAIYTVAIFIIGVLVALLVGGGVAGGIAGFGVLVGGMLLGALLVAVTALPLIMAMWFAPALVFFHGMAPGAAMKASFQACMKNWLPFLVYGLMLAVLSFFAALLLGLGFLVLIPVLSGALYASYRDIFFGV